MSSISQVDPSVALPVYLNAIRTFWVLYEAKDTFPELIHAKFPVDNANESNVHVPVEGRPDV